MATPHARGSTRTYSRARPGARGYPACAGIDLQRKRRSPVLVRLPRMRGDRPRALLPYDYDAAATPHARGSTHRTTARLQTRRGYPACAGIDPRLIARRWPTMRLPRMRGDRPVRSPDEPPLYVATPHARGSTHARISRGLTQDGYPACAGIDLEQYRSTLARTRLPRMRGDRPGTYEVYEQVFEATPHARGSTRLCR